jgi:ATP-dependent helicase HrpA
MILAARAEGVLDEVLIIAAALSVQDPRERPMDMQQAADEAHSKVRDENSDFVAYLHLWRWYEEERHQLSTNQLRRACKQSFLSFVRMREWREIHHQLKEIVGELPEGPRRDDGRPPRQRGGQQVKRASRAAADKPAVQNP